MLILFILVADILIATVHIFFVPTANDPISEELNTDIPIVNVTAANALTADILITGVSISEVLNPCDQMNITITSI